MPDKSIPLVVPSYFKLNSLYLFYDYLNTCDKLISYYESGSETELNSYTRFCELKTKYIFLLFSEKN